MQGCVFRKLRADEVPQMFSMILARMRWMDENGIRQWNATEYDRAYPLEYYMDEQYRGAFLRWPSFRRMRSHARPF